MPNTPDKCPKCGAGIDADASTDNDRIQFECETFLFPDDEDVVCESPDCLCRQLSAIMKLLRDAVRLISILAEANDTPLPSVWNGSEMMERDREWSEADAILARAKALGITT